MRIRILAVGKLKDPSYKKLFEDYLEKASRFFDIRLEEVRETPARKESEVTHAIESETKTLQSALEASSPGSIVIMDERGSLMKTIEFKTWIEARQNQSLKEMSFVIGGSYGLSETIKKEASYRLALSPMTLPHEMARVFLMEQLYRVGSIIKGMKYHH